MVKGSAPKGPVALRNDPWCPSLWDKADFFAIKGLAAGTASPEQQIRALKWIIESACATYELSFRPTSDRDTAFAEGRRFVGLQIVKAINLDLSILKRTE